jgi:hypothetical protein
VIDRPPEVVPFPVNLHEHLVEMPSPSAGPQPHPHNPRKQRKYPAAAGSGERFRKGKWRRGRA